MEIDAAYIRKALTLIAKGLTEKEKKLQEEPSGYPYSKELQHGINMLSLASMMAGSSNAGECIDENTFLSNFACNSVMDWFDKEFDKEFIEKNNLQNEPFLAYGAFAIKRGDNKLTPSSDCYEFLEAQDSDIMNGTDEHILYDKTKILSQNSYCMIRRYLINPLHYIITLDDKRKMRLELPDETAAREAFDFAYEDFTEDCYRCPTCGWTMTHGKYGYSCSSTHCTDTEPVLTDEMKFDTSSQDLFRLKKGIMRYWAEPGKLELGIVDLCEKNKLQYELWPQMDLFDVEIHFSDGKIWEIDAKAYHNPITLRTQILKKGGFPDGNYEKGYYVIPDEYAKNQQNYTVIINRAIRAITKKSVTCVTLRTLKRLIKEKEKSCHVKQQRYIVQTP